jgi:predicted flap endonuclease-1-like 5' DNA nuclease
MAKIITVEGIGAVFAEKMAQAGIETTEALLTAGSTPKGRQVLAGETGISEKNILKWLNRADLARIKGIGTQYADLLEAAGVDTVPELAQRNAANLHQKMAELNATRNLVRRIPALSAVEGWIATAKQLPRVIEY